jgi:PKD repeat protein
MEIQNCLRLRNAAPHALWLVLGVSVLAVLCATAAQAAVDVGGVTQAGTQSYSITLAKPPGLAVGDVMIAQIGFNGNNNCNTGGAGPWTATNQHVYSTSAGWTHLRSDVGTCSNRGGGQTILWKQATAADVGAANFQFQWWHCTVIGVTPPCPGSGNMPLLAGKIMAFKGVDGTTPVAVMTASPQAAGNNALTGPISSSIAGSRLVVVGSGEVEAVPSNLWTGSPTPTLLGTVQCSSAGCASSPSQQEASNAGTVAPPPATATSYSWATGSTGNYGTAGAALVLQQPKVAVSPLPNAGSESVTTVSVPVALSGMSSKTITVHYDVTAAGTATAGAGPACAAGDDFIAKSGTLTFNPLDVSKTVDVTVCDDAVLEPNTDQFTITISAPTEATLGGLTSMTYTIQDNDQKLTVSGPAPPTVNPVTEGDVGSTPVTYTLGLAPASLNTVTVHYQTTNPDALCGCTAATAGTDYTSVPDTTVTFAPGETSKTVTVQVLGDTVQEPNEDFRVRFFQTDEACLSDGAPPTCPGAAELYRIVEIRDDDNAPTDFTFTPASPCVNQPILLTPSSIYPGGAMNSWTWTIPADGSFVTGTATSQNPRVAFSTPGVHSVDLATTFTDGRHGSVTRSATVVALAGTNSAGKTCSPTNTLSIGSLSNGCKGEGMVITATIVGNYWDVAPPAPATPYDFDFDDGTPHGVQTSGTATHSYFPAPAPHTYHPTAKVTYTYGATATSPAADIIIKDVGLNTAGKFCDPAGTATIGGHSPLCLGQSATFHAGVTGDYWTAARTSPSAWAWTFTNGNPGTSSSQDAVVSFTSAGSASLTVTYDDGRTATAGPFAVTVNSAPGTSNDSNQKCNSTGTAGMVTPPFLCPNEIGTFTALSSTYFLPATSFRWDFGDGTIVGPGPSATATHAFATIGTYSVQLKVTYSDATFDTVTRPFTVCQPPIPDFAISAPGLDGLYTPFAITFTDQSTPTTAPLGQWDWKFGDGTYGSGAVASHSFSPGTYTITLTAHGIDGGAASTQRTIVVRPFQPPTIHFDVFPSPPTWGVPSQFSATVTASDTPVNGWSWTFGDGTADAGPTPMHVFARPGIYTVTLRGQDAAGVVGIQAQSISVVGTPAATPNGHGANTPRIPTVAATGSTAAIPDAASSTGTSPGAGTTPRPSTPIQSNANGNGPASRPAAIEVTRQVDALVSLRGPDASAYLWDFGDGSGTSAYPAPTHQYAAPGTYTVTLTYAPVGQAPQVLTQDVIVGASAAGAGASSPPAATSHTIATSTPAGFGWAGWAGAAALVALLGVAALLLLRVARARPSS